MKNIIIGTAGHVDHGKTSLIKALTGMETDRLKEEKKRGITIELGFAYLDLPGGERAGIIDVPGHEKFIKNMLAGAGGIDMALLIIAADDGVMPQTREHLGILSLLGIEKGIVVVTKTDLVEDDWLAMILDDIKETLKDSFLKNAPIIPVSACSGSGIDRLRQQIFSLAEEITQKNTSRPFRVPVDRVFSADGFGTVITGTLIEGSITEGDAVTVFPSMIETRVRKVQVHGVDAGRAFAGQRVAVNLAGVKKEDIKRGDTIAPPNSMEQSFMLDVKIKVLSDSPRQIANSAQMHFHHGANEEICKVILLDADKLDINQEGFAQLRFSAPVCAKKGDRFVLRFYSPVETVGGGVVLDANPLRHRRKQRAVLDSLAVKEKGSTDEMLSQAILDFSPRLANLQDIRASVAMDDASFAASMEGLKQAGQVVFLTQKCAVHMDFINKTGLKAADILASFHTANPLSPGMNVAELRGRISSSKDLLLVDRLIEAIGNQGFLRIENQKAALPGFKISFNDKQKKIFDSIDALYKKGGFSPPEIAEIDTLVTGDKAAVKQVFDAMVNMGDIVIASPALAFHRDIYAAATGIARDLTRKNGRFTLADFRDGAQTSRKFALALLELFDRKGLTQKEEDSRIWAGGE